MSLLPTHPCPFEIEVRRTEAAGHQGPHAKLAKYEHCFLGRYCLCQSNVCILIFKQHALGSIGGFQMICFVYDYYHTTDAHVFRLLMIYV